MQKETKSTATVSHRIAFANISLFVGYIQVYSFIHSPHLLRNPSTCITDAITYPLLHLVYFRSYLFNIHLQILYVNPHKDRRSEIYRENKDKQEIDKPCGYVDFERYVFLGQAFLRQKQQQQQEEVYRYKYEANYPLLNLLYDTTDIC